jgi:hypothetical protein
MEKQEKFYKITHISEKQLNVIKDALDIYSRLGTLQFDKVIDNLHGWEKSVFSDTYYEKREQIVHHCNEIKKLLVSNDTDLKNGGKGWSLGIGNKKTPMDSKISYELYGEIDHSTNEKSRGYLELSNQLPINVKEMDMRGEKISKLIKKINSNK